MKAVNREKLNLTAREVRQRDKIHQQLLDLLPEAEAAARQYNVALAELRAVNDRWEDVVADLDRLGLKLYARVRDYTEAQNADDARECDYEDTPDGRSLDEYACAWTNSGHGIFEGCGWFLGLDVYEEIGPPCAEALAELAALPTTPPDVVAPRGAEARDAEVQP